MAAYPEARALGMGRQPYIWMKMGHCRLGYLHIHEHGVVEGS